MVSLHDTGGNVNLLYKALHLEEDGFAIDILHDILHVSGSFNCNLMPLDLFQLYGYEFKR